MAEEQKKEAAAPKKGKSGLLVPALGALVVISLGVAGWFWHRSKSTQAAEPEKAASLSVLHLESFVVNLSGAAENGYLRVGIDLGIEAELKEGEKQAPYMGRLRDTILAVLGTRTVEELLTAEGKTKLKDDLLKAINDRVPEVGCREVYFTEFLVQH